MLFTGNGQYHCCFIFTGNGQYHCCFIFTGNGQYHCCFMFVSLSLYNSRLRKARQRCGYHVLPLTVVFLSKRQNLFSLCLFLTSCDAISQSFVSRTTVSFLHGEHKKLNVVSTCKMYFFPYKVPNFLSETNSTSCAL